METSQTKQNPEFLKTVYALTDGMDLNEALEFSLKQIQDVDIERLNRIGLKVYAKDKWTIHKILQHLIDWERVWCFRAIIFGREEGSTPEAHEQEIMANNSNADERSIEDQINEMYLLRQSTIMMFQSFNEKILNTTCRFFEYEMPLDAIGLTIVAHQIHHFKVIEERYWFLVE